MKTRKILFGTMVTAMSTLACGGEECAPESEEWSLDRRSWHIGAVTAMSEMVDYGVKRIALSATLPPDEMDDFIGYAVEAAASYDVPVFRESDFLVTDLFSAELTDGRDVLLICHDSTYQQYLDLKTEKQRLIDAGDYESEARTEIARKFGRLLSYTEAAIERELVN
jgi:hypothetical protein